MKPSDRIAAMQAHADKLLAGAPRGPVPLDPNSLCLWYPMVERVVPTPRTFWVNWNRDWTYALIDGEELPAEVGKALDSLMEWGDKQGWPCFFRTDHCSGKHNWSETCFLRGPDSLNSNLAPLLEYNETADIMGLPVTALVIREFLRTESPFTCYNGFPMNLERRVFVRDGEVICDHPYWPKAAVENGHPTDPDWEAKFDALYASYDDNHAQQVRGMATTVAKAIEGFWSADFLLADGEAGHGWYLTDMAVGKQSFHWEDCPNAK